MLEEQEVVSLLRGSSAFFRRSPILSQVEEDASPREPGGDFPQAVNNRYLCDVSYVVDACQNEGKWGEQRDLNPQPLDPQSSALTGLSYARHCLRQDFTRFRAVWPVFRPLANGSDDLLGEHIAPWRLLSYALVLEYSRWFMKRHIPI